MVKKICRVFYFEGDIMDAFIGKRSDLYNFFRNDVQQFTKEDILRKEFSVLTFSPHEEYIDIVKTEYDDICENLETLDVSEDRSEVYIKGIIIDIDNKKDYSIIHIQNKSVNLSLSCSKNVIYRYDTYLDIGNVIIARCHIYNTKIYMDFMIDVNFIDNFGSEIDFITGESEKIIKNKGYNPFVDRYEGLICQITYFISKNDNQCKRMDILMGDTIRTLVACKSAYRNPFFEEDLVVGDMISFLWDNSSFINNVRKI